MTTTIRIDTDDPEFFNKFEYDIRTQRPIQFLNEDWLVTSTEFSIISSRSTFEGVVRLTRVDYFDNKKTPTPVKTPGQVGEETPSPNRSAGPTTP
jgi:hypothetical protein